MINVKKNKNMAFKNNFGNQKSKLEQEFRNRATKNVNEIKEEGKKIDEENKKILKNTMKVGLGCGGVVVVGVILLIAFIIYLIVKN